MTDMLYEDNETDRIADDLAADVNDYGSFDFNMPCAVPYVVPVFALALGAVVSAVVLAGALVYAILYGVRR